MRRVVYGDLVSLAGPARPRVRDEMRDLAIVPNGALVVDEDILWIGPRNDVPSELLHDAQIIDHTGRIVTPGLLDAHAHPVFAGERSHEFALRAEGRSYQEIAAAGGGILTTVKATRAASQDELVKTGRRHLDWMLANGTTTVEAKSGYGLSLEHELKMLRAIKDLGAMGPIELVPTFLGAHAIPPEHKENPAEYQKILCDKLIPEVARQGLAEFADAFMEERYFTGRSCREILSCAKQNGLGIRLHADQLTCSGAAELAAELGAKTADHLEKTGTAGIRALVEAGVQPVLLPGSVYALGLQDYPRAREMIEAGLAVVLATDFNPGSSPVASLPFVMSLACTQMKMTPAEALTSCTVNAALSLNRSDRGSLEPGKRGDFVLWDCQRPEEIPYWLGASLVQSVYIRGRKVWPSVAASE